jgi:hypothetical protein
MIEKRWPNHVEASIIEASHESDILILGNRIPLQAIALRFVLDISFGWTYFQPDV